MTVDFCRRLSSIRARRMASELAQCRLAYDGEMSRRDDDAASSGAPQNLALLILVASAEADDAYRRFIGINGCLE